MVKFLSKHHRIGAHHQPHRTVCPNSNIIIEVLDFITRTRVNLDDINHVEFRAALYRQPILRGFVRNEFAQIEEIFNYLLLSDKLKQALINDCKFVDEYILLERFRMDNNNN